MKGSETRLIAYMQGSDKRFVIPVYQRKYNWKIENCEQLYNDLKKIIRNQRKSHFFGSIVSVFNPDGEYTEFQIIDGQQRLTTVSLLFLAMRNLIKNGIVDTKRPDLADKIYRTYLIDEWQRNESPVKLKLVKTDRNAFDKLFDDKADYIQDSKLTINYQYFYNRIQKQEITVDELFDAICRLEIISIQLNQDDNPQLIFESLNSTGLALSEGDKIRNFILMGLKAKQQNIFYEKYWNKIEICTDYEVTAYIRDYLSIKQQITPAFSKVYVTFKAYVEAKEIDIESLLKDLLFYARLYKLLLHGGVGDKQVDNCIYRLNRLETTVTRPFFLEVLRLKTENKLKIEDVANIFLTTEAYLFRRTICDLPTNALNKIFLLLHKEIVRYDGTEDNYVEKFKYALLSKKERMRFPDDEEFIEAFKTRNLYLMNSKNKIYMLERFENSGTIEDKNIYRHFDDGEYSVEHIMPQHLTPAWVESLGTDYEQIHAQWLHRIANLTLTAYNSKYSNSTFNEKKSMKNGFRESGIRMNMSIAQENNWGLPELEKRSQDLMQSALQIWAAPVTNYIPTKKQLDFYTLDDDMDFKGRSIVRFSYKNMEQPVTSWIDMYERVLRILHTKDKSVLLELAYTTNNNAEEFAAYVSHDKAAFRNAGEIDAGVYVERNTSTERKIYLLRKFFELYNADPADLVLYLRDESDESNNGELDNIRRRYWTFALDYIHEAHKDKGTFANVITSKQSWINGFFGISGFSICCVANSEASRVEIYMGKPKKEENKAAFDSLLHHKSEIENALGVPLCWVRGNNSKSSKVYCQLDNVNIKQETDWIQMAKFHAEWSKKFYDVIVPFLLAIY